MNTYSNALEEYLLPLIEYVKEKKTREIKKFDVNLVYELSSMTRMDVSAILPYERASFQIAE